MKNYFRIFLVFAFVLFSFTSYAQKIGHINFEDLIRLMPETAAANKELETLGSTYRKELESLDAEIKNKFVVYQNNNTTWAEDVTKEKFDELQALSAKLDARSAEVEQEFQVKQEEKLAPIYEKATNTVNKVAKENGVACIFNARMLMYADESTSFDLLPLVKKELGIQ